MFAHFFDEWSHCDFCFKNFGIFFWTQESQRKKPFSDFPAHGPGMYMLWFNFILGLIFIFFCFKLIIIHYHTQKQKKIKIKPKIKLNHNIYPIVRDTRRSCGGPLTWKAQIHDGGLMAVIK